MKRIIILSLNLILLNTLNIFAANKTSIAVYDIKVSENLINTLTADEKNSLGIINNAFKSKLESQLAGTKKFAVVTRSDLKIITKEQELTQSGLVDINNNNIAQIGKISGANYLIVCNVTNYKDLQVRKEIVSLERFIEKRDVSITLICNLYNSSTGVISDSFVSTAKFNETKERGKLSVSEKLIKDDILDEISNNLCADVSQNMSNVLFPPKVIRVKGNQITINSSVKSGIKLKEIWDVYELGEDLIDPDTGVNLGKSEDLIGTIQITRITSNFSIGEILKNQGIKVGNVLRKSLK